MGKFVAVEIGHKLTKVIYGNEKKNELSIIDYRIIHNSEKIFNPDGDLNINEIQPLLKSHLKEMKVRRVDCYLTVGGQSGIVRLREMPLVKLKDMTEIVRFEAEQFLPYNIDGFYVDFRVNQIKSNVDESTNESEKNDEVAEVMIVAAPKEMVDEQVHLIDKLRLNIKRVDYYTDAVYCYFKRYVLDEDSNSLIVDLGSNGMKITMFNGKKYFANIYSEVGLNDLIERYSEQNDVNADIALSELIVNTVQRSVVVETVHNKLERLREALQFKKSTKHHQNLLEFNIDPKLERIYEPLAYEITKMMEFFKTRQFGMSVDKIYLIGGGANVRSFDEFLKYYHNIDVAFVENITSGKPIESIDYPLLIPAIGSLLKGGC